MAYAANVNATTGTSEAQKTEFKRCDINAASINSIATVLTPTSGKKFRLLGGAISVSSAASVLFEDNAAATANFIFRSPVLAVNTPFTFDLGRGVASSTADNVLKATGSASANLTGTLYYTEE